MKKLAAAILLLLYFAVSTGFVLSVHYCMNKVDSVQLGDSSNDECSKCGMHIKEGKGCCKDDVKVVKMQMDHSFAKISYADFSLHLQPVSFQEIYTALLQNTSDEKYPLAHGPPLSKRAIYLKNCVFRV